MKRRTRISFVCIFALLPVLAWFEPTYVVRGWLRGEAFYQGRPASYWRRELECGGRTILVTRTRDGSEERTDRWMIGPSFMDGYFPRAWQQGYIIVDDFPAILSFDPARREVLQELLNDPTPNIRALADWSLQGRPKQTRRPLGHIPQ
jgi:hypothetical protein